LKHKLLANLASVESLGRSLGAANLAELDVGEAPVRPIEVQHEAQLVDAAKLLKQRHQHVLQISTPFYK